MRPRCVVAASTASSPLPNPREIVPNWEQFLCRTANSIELEFPAPEPSAGTLVVAGAACLFWLLRRARISHAKRGTTNTQRPDRGRRAKPGLAGRRLRTERRKPRNEGGRQCAGETGPLPSRPTHRRSYQVTQPPRNSGPSGADAIRCKIKPVRRTSSATLHRGHSQGNRRAT